DALHELDIALVARVKRAVGARFEQVRVSGQGCAHCAGRGTIGRTVVAEVIRPDARLFRLLRDGRKADAADYWHDELGGQTVARHTVEKVAAGLVDPRMAERVIGLLPAPADGERVLPFTEGDYGT